MKSAEVRYQPKGDIKGYTGAGFVETDHSTGTLSIPVSVPETGDYVIRLIYTNGNGSVTTESSAAIRTMAIDGNRAGAVVLPHRGEGNWSDWGESTAIKAHLEKGSHMLTLSLEPENENMDRKTNHALIDAVKITKL